jgi:hypothetical protein
MAQDPTPKQLQLLRAGTVIEGTHVVPKVVRVRQSSQQPTAAAAGAAGSGAQPRSGSSGGSSRRGSRSSGGSSSRSSSRAEGAGRCVLQLDVSEGKKHEVGTQGLGQAAQTLRACTSPGAFHPGCQAFCCHGSSLSIF